MDAPKITIGFLLGDLWGWLAVNAMQNSSWNADVTIFMTLFLLGGVAVIIAAMGSEMIHCPSWLCGWAITLTVLAPLEQGLQGSYAIQIAVAMTVGVWYVGAFLNTVQQCILRFTEGHTSNDINFAGRKSS
jgi:hypothetical protein